MRILALWTNACRRAAWTIHLKKAKEKAAATYDAADRNPEMGEGNSDLRHQGRVDQEKHRISPTCADARITKKSGKNTGVLQDLR
jgi:hypothetical protein